MVNLRNQILSIVKEAFNKGEEQGKRYAEPIESKSDPVHYKSIHNIEDTMVGDVLIDLSDPTLKGYVVYENKNWKSVLWSNGKLIGYKADGEEDFCVRQLRNVSTDKLFRWLTQ